MVSSDCFEGINSFFVMCKALLRGRIKVSSSPSSSITVLDCEDGRISR